VLLKPPVNTWRGSSGSWYNDNIKIGLRLHVFWLREAPCNVETQAANPRQLPL